MISSKSPVVKTCLSLLIFPKKCSNSEPIFTVNFSGSESCEDLCKENWHDWSEWSDCPICGRNATQQRYRACDGSGYVFPWFSEVNPGLGIRSKNQSQDQDPGPVPTPVTNHTLILKFNKHSQMF